MRFFWGIFKHYACLKNLAQWSMYSKVHKICEGSAAPITGTGIIGSINWLPSPTICTSCPPDFHQDAQQNQVDLF